MKQSYFVHMNCSSIVNLMIRCALAKIASYKMSCHLGGGGMGCEGVAVYAS